jgi:hypothetical protein
MHVTFFKIHTWHFVLHDTTLYKKMFIIVQVNEGAKIITGPLAKEVEESSLFSTLFDSIISGNYFHQNVRVEVKKTETGPWVPVHKGLEGKLLLMKTLGFIYLKYILLPCDFAITGQKTKNRQDYLAKKALPIFAYFCLFSFILAYSCLFSSILIYPQIFTN